MEKEKITLKISDKTVKKVPKKIILKKGTMNKNPFFNKSEVLIKARNLRVEFGKGSNKLVALKNLNFNIYKGEVLGLVGESGSGKSTTGRALTGLLDRTAGTVQIKDFKLPSKTKNIKGLIKKKMINNVQMIFQDPTDSLNSQKTILNVVSEGLVNNNVKEILFTSKYNSIKMDLWKNYSILLDEYIIFSEKDLSDKHAKFDKKSNELIDALDKIKEIYPSTKVYISFIQGGLKETFLSNKSKKELIERKVIELLNEVGLDQGSLNRYPLEFSGGQQQRVGISRALAVNPSFIVADEPISALDVSIQAQVINIFNEMKEKYNLTMLFIAHDLRMVEYISDRIAVMYKGEIIEIGKTESVTKNPIHPYTKILLENIPSIDDLENINGSKVYNSNIWNPKKEKKIWHQIGEENHFIFASKSEYKKIRNNEGKGVKNA